MEDFKTSVNAAEYVNPCSTADCNNLSVGRTFVGLLGSTQMWRYYCRECK